MPSATACRPSKLQAGGERCQALRTVNVHMRMACDPAYSFCWLLSPGSQTRVNFVCACLVHMIQARSSKSEVDFGGVANLGVGLAKLLGS